MRHFIFFFILFTIAEIVFSLTYYLIAEKVDRVILLGAGVYAAGMVTGYIAYRVFRYRAKRKALIDSLP